MWSMTQITSTLYHTGGDCIEYFLMAVERSWCFTNLNQLFLANLSSVTTRVLAHNCKHFGAKIRASVSTVLLKYTLCWTSFIPSHSRKMTQLINGDRHFWVYSCNMDNLILCQLNIRFRYNPLIGPWEISIQYWKNNFQANFSDWWLWYLKRNYPQVNITGPWWW